MSLNSLTNACNQKSNRQPVLSLDEQTVQATADRLISNNLVGEVQVGGSRVVKYKHRFCNTEFGELDLTEQELAIVCLLFLRGPQTSGELRNRSNRLCHFNDVAEVELVLNQMIARDDGPFVCRLPRQLGKRENRYAHLFSGKLEAELELELELESVQTTTTVGPDNSNQLLQRTEKLEEQVADLKATVEGLRVLLDELIA